MVQPTNWTGVCSGSILAECDSLAKQGFPRPEARAKAIEFINLYMQRAFSPHGECEEGIGYWRYGWQMTCVGLSRLSMHDLREVLSLNRLKQVAAYPGKVNLFKTTFWTSNDGGSNGPASPSFVPWLAAATGDPFLARWQCGMVDDYIRNFSLLMRAFDGFDRRPDMLDDSSPAKTAAPGATFIEDQQAIIIRRSTPAGELIVCLMGDTNDEPHNHNDLGHVTVAVGERIILPESGQPRYTPSFFGPNRYKSLASSSRGHSCPIINGFEQRAGSDAHSAVVSSNTSPARLLLDLKSAYPAEAMLKRWTRELSDDSEVKIVDTLKTSDSNIPIIHVIWSIAAPTTSAGEHKSRLVIAAMHTSARTRRVRIGRRTFVDRIRRADA